MIGIRHSQRIRIRFMLRPALLAFLALASASTFAQTLRPPADLRGGQRYEPEFTQGADAAQLMLRIDRLEGQVRNLTGQLEQMQFQNRRLEEQLKKFQQDVEFRFQEMAPRGGAQPARPATPAAPAGQPQRRTEVQPGPVAPPPGANPGPDATTPLSPAPPTRLAGRPGRNDAFDPEANPSAPGAPRPLGQPQQQAAATPARQPLPRGAIDDEDEPADINAPIELTPGANPPPARRIEEPRPTPTVLPTQPPATATPPGPPTVAPPTPREEFDRARASLRGKQYAEAETGFRAFLQKFPKSSLAADATYNLGESYFQRRRSREAAEQYLKISTDYAQASIAPAALLKLGLSLDQLGAKEQACAAWGEIGRKYPNASAAIKTSADREQKRAQC
jgi:tol-pal system protein YbgF